jgi:toxin ParE1/3/4
MGKVIWAPSAIADVDSIAEYVARDSIEQARFLVARLFEATGRLKEFPLSGRMILEIGSESCREIIFGSYRIMYRVEGKDIWITGVVHGARDWSPK